MEEIGVFLAALGLAFMAAAALSDWIDRTDESASDTPFAKVMAKAYRRNARVLSVVGRLLAGTGLLVGLSGLALRLVR